LRWHLKHLGFGERKGFAIGAFGRKVAAGELDDTPNFCDVHKIADS